MNRTLKIATMFIAIALFASTGCKKKEETPVPADANIQASEDNSQMEGEFNSVYDFAEDVGNNQQGVKGSGKTNGWWKLTPCATITILDTMSATKKISITFNPDTTGLVRDGCLCHDGRTRKGSIDMEFTGKMKDAGSTVKATLKDNYHVYLNGGWVKHTGTKTIKNITTNWLRPKFENVVTNATAVTLTGTITWNATRTLEKTDETIFDWLDDKYEIGGSSSGTNRQGHNFTCNITQNLKIKVGCKFIYAGKWSLNNTSTNQSMELDYNPGGVIPEPCDDQADVTYTVGGQSRTKRITIR